MNKILAVDDSATMRQLVSFTLKKAGFAVTSAHDGLQALDIAKEEEFDLILSDINMPNMNGIELCKQLRTINDYKSTPILMLTTEASEKEKMHGKSAGASGWIIKPFNPNQLLKTVSRILD